MLKIGCRYKFATLTVDSEIVKNWSIALDSGRVINTGLDVEGSCLLPFVLKVVETLQ